MLQGASIGLDASGHGIAAMALAMLTNPYLTDKVITVDGGLYPA